MTPEDREEEVSGDPGEDEQSPEDVPTLEPPSDGGDDKPDWFDVPPTIKKTLMQGGMDAPVFAFHLKGGSVSSQGAPIDFLARFLDEFRKLFAPLQVIPTGKVPEGNRLPQSIALPPNVFALQASGSVTIHFSLNPIEVEISAERGIRTPSLLTVRAAGHLGALLGMDPSEGDLVEEVEPFGRRIGRSYGKFAELLADEEVEADWYSDVYERDIEIRPGTAREIADELIHKERPQRRTFTTGAFMSEAAMASDKRVVRLVTDFGARNATYDIPLATRVTEALSHIVKVRLRETAYRYPFAEKPHKREWELLEILDVGEASGALAEAEKKKR